jgi:acetolactate synthase-1/3 small subunit
MKAHYLLTILSENKKGLVSNITGRLNRKLIAIESICTAHTDIHCQIIIDLMIVAESIEIKNTAARISNIIEVYNVRFELTTDALYEKLAIYTLEKESYNSKMFQKLQKYGAYILCYEGNDLIIEKIGREEDIMALYNELEGPHLKSFKKSAAISLRVLGEERSSVISMAA